MNDLSKTLSEKYVKINEDQIGDRVEFRTSYCSGNDLNAFDIFQLLNDRLVLDI